MAYAASWDWGLILLNKRGNLLAAKTLDNELLKTQIANLEQRVVELKEDKHTAEARLDALIERW